MLPLVDHGHKVIRLGIAAVGGFDVDAIRHDYNLSSVVPHVGILCRRQ